MKRLSFAIIFTISLGAYQAQTTGNKDKHSDKTTVSKGSESQEGQSSQPSVIQQTIYSAPSEQEGQGQTSNSAKAPHDWIDKVNAFSTLVIALFTILLFLAVIGQTRTTRNSERAWLMLDEFSDERRNFNRDGIDIVFWFKNYGKTPAWVVESSFSFVQVSEEIYKRNLFEYGPADTFPSGNPVPPDKPYEVMRIPLALSEDIVLHPDKPSHIIFYGYIKYRDVFFYKIPGTVRETHIRKRFHRTPDDAFMERPGTWVYDGPPEANRHT